MKRLTMAVVVVGLLGLTGCRSRAPGPGEARLSDVSGRVEASSPRQSWRQVHGGLLHSGDRVRVRSPGGRAVLTLDGGRVLELRGGSAVRVAATPHLLAGDLLAEATVRPLDVSAASAAVRLGRETAARLSSRLSADAAVYRGRLRMTSAGRGLSVPALRQATVAGPGLVPDQPVPLRYRASDAWDRRSLGDAIDLGRDLDARSQGITSQLGPGQGRTAGFYQLVLPGLDSQPGFTQALLDGTTADLTTGERLVGAVIATEGRRGSFARRWAAVFAFRTAGAEWGLVALDQGVTSAGSLVGTLDQALGRLTAPGAVAAPLNLGGGGPVGRPPPGGGTTAPTTPTTSPTPPTSPTTPPTTAPPPVTVPPQVTVPPGVPTTLPPTPRTGVGQVDQTVDPLTDPVIGTVNGLLGGLLNPPPH